MKKNLIVRDQGLFLLLQLCFMLCSFGVCHPVFAQVVIDSDSTYSTSIKTYFLNDGSYFRHPTDYMKSGLECPREGGDGFVFGAGFWIGVQFTDDFDIPRKRVLQTYNPIWGESMCVPGNYKDGNLFRPDLQALYAVKHQQSASHEALSSTFHDGDLRQYPQHLDTNSWRSMGMPLGFQFDQRMKVWSGSELDNTVAVETTVRYIGERKLDSVYFCSVTDVAIGQIENAIFADTGDVCVIQDKDQQYPFIVASSAMEGERRFGTLGIGLVSVDPLRRLDGIRIIGGDMVGNSHDSNYELMSGGILDDILPPGDKVALLSVLVGDLVKGDSFKITIGYVVAPHDVPQPAIEIRNKLNQLRSQLTAIAEHFEPTEHNRINSQVVYGNSFHLPDEFCTVTNVTIVSTLGEKNDVKAHQGLVDLTGLPNGSYLICLSNQQTQLFMKLIIVR